MPDQSGLLPGFLPGRLQQLVAMLQMSLGHKPVFSTAGGDQTDSALPHGKNRRLLNYLLARLDISTHDTSPRVRAYFKTFLWHKERPAQNRF